MFKFILSCKDAINVQFQNHVFRVDELNEKLVEFSDSSSFSFDYFFAGNNSFNYHVEVVECDGRFNVFGDNVELISYGENLYKIEIKQKNMGFLQKKVKKTQKNGYFFNFFENGLIEIETEDKVLFSNSYNFNIEDASVLELKNNTFCLNIYDKDNSKSIIINNNFFEVLQFDNAVVESTETGFKVLIDTMDISSHGLVKIYEIDEDIVLVDEYSVYLKGKPINDFNNKIIPLHFLQCVRYKDFVEAKKWLSPELQAKVSVEHLSKYFGNFEEIDFTNF